MKNCLNCGQPILHNLSFAEIFCWCKAEESDLCGFCRKQLIVLSEQKHCQKCCKIDENEICFDCIRWNQQQIDNRHVALFGYNDFMHDYFKKYKRYGDVLLSRTFQADIRQWANQHQFDVITYIPSSKSHFEVRGFDPVYEMYKHIFELESIFVKFDADKPQSQKNRLERMTTEQTFKIKDDFPKMSLNFKILIVDDIYTTGRTILHARQLLSDIGFQNIYTFSLTR